MACRWSGVMSVWSYCRVLCCRRVSCQVSYRCRRTAVCRVAGVLPCVVLPWCCCVPCRCGRTARCHVVAVVLPVMLPFAHADCCVCRLSRTCRLRRLSSRALPIVCPSPAPPVTQPVMQPVTCAGGCNLGCLLSAPVARAGGHTVCHVHPVACMGGRTLCHAARCLRHRTTNHLHGLLHHLMSEKKGHSPLFASHVASLLMPAHPPVHRT